MFVPKIFGQYSLFIKNILKNDSIKYKIIMKTKNISSKNQLSGGYYVKIRMDSKANRYFKNQGFEFWKNRLLDSMSDWASNLILYSVRPGSSLE